MSLKKPKPERGGIIELATDPAAENSGYEVNSGTLWLNTGVNPAVLNERNNANTGWNQVGSSSNGSASSGGSQGHAFAMGLLFGS